jgi:Protein of unknown function (DUF2971)
LPRTHNKDFFYKYTTANTAKTILRTCSLRWSSPLLFNDPFDHQARYLLPFSQDDFILKCESAIERIIFGDEVSLEFPTTLGSLLSLMRSGRDKLPKDEVMAQLRDGIKKTAAGLQKFEDKVNQYLLEQLEKTRVLCVSEHNDNVIMWSHYADEHKGIVMRLRCIEELDNNLLIARKMKYQKKYPAIADLDDFIKLSTGEKNINYYEKLMDIAYIKHEVWAYEDEWRVVTEIDTEENKNLYNDYQEYPRVFDALYFGCRISESDKGEIIDMLSGDLVHVEIFQAKKKAQEFGLQFERIR